LAFTCADGYTDAQPDGCAHGHNRAYGDLDNYARTTGRYPYTDGVAGSS
jgi:hypothetical protein